MLKCAYLRLFYTFVIGFSLGFLLPQCFLQYQESQNKLNSYKISNQEIFKSKKLFSTSQNENSSSNTQADSSLKPKVLCYILTAPSLHEKSIHVKETWGKRCDRLIFFSSGQDERLPTEVLNVTEGYAYLWQKSRQAAKFILNNYPQYDWYLKADDDTYIIVENLRYFLMTKNPNDPVYYGAKFKKFVKQGYMSGGGGYVLSREALARLVNEAFEQEEGSSCAHRENTGPEDLHIGRCLESVGVAAGDSLDSKGKPRFFSIGPTSIFFKGSYVNTFHWYWKYIWHKHSLGRKCCSEYTISFHNIDPRMMWSLEMLIYNIKVYDSNKVLSSSNKATDIIQN